MSQQHRADVDGLRAVAVASVLLYHAGVLGFAGGYVGVDVFFVISGFVIARSVSVEVERRTFSIVGFWERRVRRLFPALYLMIAAALAVGFAIQMPDDFKRLGQSVVANAVFLSNAFFLKDSGYFGVAPQLKPLLHTWSLSLEEQFYLLLPLALAAVPKLPRALTGKRVLVAVYALSFALSVGLTPYERSAAFFLLPTRAWELLTGVFLALGYVPSRMSEKARLPLGLTGLACLGVAIAMYDESLAFPGMYAALPVFGTALLVASGEGADTVVTRALAARPVVYVGKLSYPLYLWHFPVFGFAAYLSLRAPTPTRSLALLALTVVLAVGSYELVETPFREKRVFSSRRGILAFGAVVALTSIACGLGVHLGRGLEARIPSSRLTFVRGATDHVRRDECMAGDVSRAFASCAFGEATSETTIVWGDSHAEALLPGLIDRAKAAGKRLVFAGSHGCPIELFLGQERYATRECQRFGRAMFEATLASNAKTVILASIWNSVELTEPDVAAPRVEELVRQLLEAKKQVVLVLPVPRPLGHVPRGLYVQSFGVDRDVELRPTAERTRRATARTRALFADLEKRLHGVHIADPLGALCESGDGLCAIERDGRPLYFDDNHLTTLGAAVVAERLPLLE